MSRQGANLTATGVLTPSGLAEVSSEAVLADVARMIRHAFAGTPEGVADWLRVAGRENLRVRLESGRAVATLLRVPMGMFLGGASVPMVGVAGVAVAPEDRGRGHGKSLMTEFVRGLHDEGVAISGLFASTQTLYRGVGYEQAGVWCEHVVPLNRIDVRGHGQPLVPLDDSDMPAVRECYTRFARMQNGMLDRGPYIWARVRKFREKEYHGFGLRSASGSLLGYVFLHQDRQPDGRQRILLTDLVFSDLAAGRRLLAFLADYEMMGHDMVLCGGPTHPALFLLNQQRFQTTVRERWFVRVTHVQRALAARGYAPGIESDCEFEIDDPLIERNRGPWAVRVRDGRASVERVDRAVCVLDIRGVAPLLTGWMSPEQLRLVGLASGEDAALARIGTVFSGATPAMTEMF
ncbi:MAG: GNAT family N-acetyltransferase [Phycisphaerae bacterium]|nr:GNAT family N-acetyltransferase [Phycisphaerae bacterium]